RIYIANAGYSAIGGNAGITVVDGSTNAFFTLVDHNAIAEWDGSNTRDIAVDTSTHRIYVSNGQSNNITVVDGLTYALTTITDPNAKDPTAVAVNPVTGRVYVANAVSNNVTVIDDTTGAGVPPRLCATVAPGADSICVNGSWVQPRYPAQGPVRRLFCRT